jgi:hypothetical protein
MPGTTNDLHGVLDGFSKFLREKDLAPARHQPYLVRWVREFLLFAQTHRGYSFEQTLDLFLGEVSGRVGVKPWQTQQARRPPAPTSRQAASPRRQPAA